MSNIHNNIISEKMKQFLTEKLESCHTKLIKTKRQRKLLQVLCASTILSSIILSTLVASINLPHLAVTLISISSAVLTAISSQFHLQDKKHEITKLVLHLHKLECKMQYVINCNGDLKSDEYDSILKEYSFIV
jgi:hypothetical protein